MNRKNIPLLNYKIIGEGVPVVFLHGFLEDNKMWDTILAKLPPIKAICIELPGHGSSPLLSEELKLSSIAKAVGNTLAFLNIDDFSIVGHSLGGYVALYLADLPSIHIEHIVLLNSHPWADVDSKKRNRSRAAKIVAYNKLLFLKEAIPNLYCPNNIDQHQSEIKDLIQSANKMSVTSIQQTLNAMRDREEKVKVLKHYGKRLHIIQGEFDHLIQAKKMENMASKYNNNYHLVRNVGHMAHHESADQVIQLLQFLS